MKTYQSLIDYCKNPQEFASVPKFLTEKVESITADKIFSFFSYKYIYQLNKKELHDFELLIKQFPSHIMEKSRKNDLINKINFIKSLVYFYHISLDVTKFVQSEQHISFVDQVKHGFTLLLGIVEDDILQAHQKLDFIKKVHDSRSINSLISEIQNKQTSLLYRLKSLKKVQNELNHICYLLFVEDTKGAYRVKIRDNEQLKSKLFHNPDFAVQFSPKFSKILDYIPIDIHEIKDLILGFVVDEVITDVLSTDNVRDIYLRRSEINREIVLQESYEKNLNAIIHNLRLFMESLQSFLNKFTEYNDILTERKNDKEWIQEENLVQSSSLSVSFVTSPPHSNNKLVDKMNDKIKILQERKKNFIEFIKNLVKIKIPYTKNQSEDFDKELYQYLIKNLMKEDKYIKTDFILHSQMYQSPKVHKLLGEIIDKIKECKDEQKLKIYYNTLQKIYTKVQILIDEKSDKISALQEKLLNIQSKGIPGYKEQSSVVYENYRTLQKKNFDTEIITRKKQMLDRLANIKSKINDIKEIAQIIKRYFSLDIVIFNSLDEELSYLSSYSMTKDLYIKLQNLRRYIVEATKTEEFIETFLKKYSDLEKYLNIDSSDTQLVKINLEQKIKNVSNELNAGIQESNEKVMLYFNSFLHSPKEGVTLSWLTEVVANAPIEELNILFTFLMDKHNISPADLYRNNGNNLVHELIEKNKIIDNISLFLKGRDINAVNKHGNTYLHLAGYAMREILVKKDTIWFNNYYKLLDLIKILITLGCDWTKENPKKIDFFEVIFLNDTDGQLTSTLLDLLYNEDILECLKNTKLSSNVSNDNSKLLHTLAHYSKHYQNYVDNSKSSWVFSDLFYNVASKLQLDINSQNSEGNTPMHILVETIDVGIDYFIDDRFNWDFAIKNNKGESVMHKALRSPCSILFYDELATTSIPINTFIDYSKIDFASLTNLSLQYKVGRCFLINVLIKQIISEEITSSVIKSFIRQYESNASKAQLLQKLAILSKTKINTLDDIKIILSKIHISDNQTTLEESFYEVRATGSVEVDLSVGVDNQNVIEILGEGGLSS